MKQRIVLQGMMIAFAHVAAYSMMPNGTVEIEMGGGKIKTIKKDDADKFVEAYDEWANKGTAKGVASEFNSLVDDLLPNIEKVIEKVTGKLGGAPALPRSSGESMCYMAERLKTDMEHLEELMGKDKTKALKDVIKKGKAFLKTNEQALAADGALIQELEEIVRELGNIVNPIRYLPIDEPAPGEDTAPGDDDGDGSDNGDEA